MPRFRATVTGPDLEKVDGILREAKVGVVVALDVEDGTTASGVPSDEPETEGLVVSIDAGHDGDASDAESRLTEALGDEYSVSMIDS